MLVTDFEAKLLAQHHAKVMTGVALVCPPDKIEGFPAARVSEFVALWAQHRGFPFFMPHGSSTLLMPHNEVADVSSMRPKLGEPDLAELTELGQLLAILYLSDVDPSMDNLNSCLMAVMSIQGATRLSYQLSALHHLINDCVHSWLEEVYEPDVAVRSFGNDWIKDMIQTMDTWNLKVPCSIQGQPKFVRPSVLFQDHPKLKSSGCGNTLCSYYANGESNNCQRQRCFMLEKNSPSGSVSEGRSEVARHIAERLKEDTPNVEVLSVDLGILVSQSDAKVLEKHNMSPVLLTALSGETLRLRGSIEFDVSDTLTVLGTFVAEPDGDCARWVIKTKETT